MVTAITKTESGRMVGPRLMPMPLVVLRYASFLGDAVHAERKLVAVDGQALKNISWRFIIKGHDGRGALGV
eukprot:5279743-Prymnesium_polylepis.1